MEATAMTNGTGDTGEQGGQALDRQLLELLEYRVVLGALVTTLDGLVVGHAGLNLDDAELLAATGSQAADADYATDVTRGGVMHALRGRDMRLIILTDTETTRPAVESLMADSLAGLEESIAG
jgi:predicted regulator of Ras-like GTPase activity (Roadblock/LC7/MglB family)